MQVEQLSDIVDKFDQTYLALVQSNGTLIHSSFDELQVCVANHLPSELSQQSSIFLFSNMCWVRPVLISNFSVYMFSCVLLCADK